MKKKKTSQEVIFRTEFEEQCAVFKLARLFAQKYPELRFLIGSLSGIKMTIGMAVKAKNAGCLVKGIPDLFLPIVRGGYCGLWTELKRRQGGKILPEQKEWAVFLVDQGYKHVFAYGADEAWTAIINYLECKDD